MEIKIGNTKYKIKIANKVSIGNRKFDGLIHFDGKDISGYVKKTRNTIEVENNKNKEHILFHEIAHGLFATLGKDKPCLKRLTTSCNNNENFIDGLAILMMGCFDIKYIKKDK